MSANSASVASAPKLVINRRLNAPVERVYAAWTDPAKIVQWFGPSDKMTCQVPELELGGRRPLHHRHAQSRRRSSLRHG